jgi:hypothetical protein
MLVMQDMDRSHYARTTLEAIRLWSETNMQVWRQVLNCAAGTAREGLHLAIELQTSAVEATQHAQDCMFQCFREMSEAPKQPLDYYQKSLQACTNTAEQFYKLQIANAQVSLRSAEQVVILAQQASTKVQESYKEYADKLKSLYMPA